MLFCQIDFLLLVMVEIHNFGIDVALLWEKTDRNIYSPNAKHVPIELVYIKYKLTVDIN